MLVAAKVPPPVGLGVVGAVDTGVGHVLELRADILGVLERYALGAGKLRRRQRKPNDRF